MVIRQHFEYPTLERTTLPDGNRFYLDPTDGTPLPSVTTILSHTKDKTFLVEWEKRIGKDKADAIRTQATDIGTLMHTHLECHIQGIDRPRGSNLIRVMASDMADVIIRDGLTLVDEVWGIEVPLYFPQLYAGTTDLIGVYKGKPAIMDYKNTKKMKTKAMMEDYFCQCVAYALAHNYLYDTCIQQVVIFMCSREHYMDNKRLEFEAFAIEGAEFERYADIWLKRVAQYDDTGGPRA